MALKIKKLDVNVEKKVLGFYESTLRGYSQRQNCKS